MREQILSWKCSLFSILVLASKIEWKVCLFLVSIVRHCCEDFLLPSVSLLLNNHGSHVISVQEIVAAIASRDATYDSEFHIELSWLWPRNQ